MTVKITFLGTGEFSSPDRYHTSILVENNIACLQVDCGANIPYSFSNLFGNDAYAAKPDAILLTHTHWDHAGGVSGEILAITNALRASEKQRKLILAGEYDAVENIAVRRRVDYPFQTDYQAGYLQTEFIPIKQADAVQLKELGKRFGFKDLRAAESRHSNTNLAYRFDCGDFSFAISGDGSLTDETKKLYEGADVLVHEAFHFGPSTLVHQGIGELIDYSIERGIKHVVLVHMENSTRKGRQAIEYQQKKGSSNGVNVVIPDDHEVYEVGIGTLKYVLPPK